MSKLPIPAICSRVSYRLSRPTVPASGTGGLGGTLSEGGSTGVVANGTTYREIVACAGANNIRVRILTVGATGTLNVKPVAPVGASITDESIRDRTGFIEPSKVTAYATGTGTAAVVAATELKVDLALFGENYVMVEFVCTANGTITWCDVAQLVYT